MPGLTETQRQALRQRCADRAVEAVSRAIDLGYDNIRRLGDHPDDVRHEECRGFWNLRDDPAFQKLIGAMRAKRSAEVTLDGDEAAGWSPSRSRCGPANLALRRRRLGEALSDDPPDP